MLENSDQSLVFSGIYLRPVKIVFPANLEAVVIKTCQSHLVKSQHFLFLYKSAVYFYCSVTTNRQDVLSSTLNLKTLAENQK